MNDYSDNKINLILCMLSMSVSGWSFGIIWMLPLTVDYSVFMLIFLGISSLFVSIFFGIQLLKKL